MYVNNQIKYINISSNILFNKYINFVNAVKFTYGKSWKKQQPFFLILKYSILWSNYNQ